MSDAGQESVFKLSSADGETLYVYHWPSSSPRGIVQISHGAAEHAARYRWTAQKLNEAGYTVYANDHRGHGLTGEHGEMGHFADDNGWNKLVDDLYQLNQHIRRRHPNIPLVLLGHSMGSFLTQQYLIEHGSSIDAVVLSGTTVADGYAQLEPLLEQELAELGRRAESKLMKQLTRSQMSESIADARTDFDWLSRDADQVAAYIADPLCGIELRVGSIVDMISAMQITNDPQQLKRIPADIPMYILAGTMDPLNNNLEALHLLIERYKEAGLTQISSRFYEDGRHEMFNEVNREEVLADLLAWLNLHCAESGANRRQSV